MRDGAISAEICVLLIDVCKQLKLAGEILENDKTSHISFLNLVTRLKKGYALVWVLQVGIEEIKYIIIYA